MKRFLLIVASLMLTTAVWANYWWDNYPPDNTQVKLTQTNLPIVFIDVDGQMLDRDTRITARMKIIDNGPGRLNYADTVAHPNQYVDYEGYIALRYRGNTSFSASDKKPYSFRTLDKPLEEGGVKVKVKILGMPKDNNWALLAPYADKSMMRDMLAFELARPWMDYTPQGRYCEMFLDGIYYGVFIMCEVPSKGKKRLNLEDPGTSGDALTGGYMMEVGRNEGKYYTSKYHPVSATGTLYNNKYIRFEYKSPDYEDMNSTQINYIKNRIDQMENALAADNFADPNEGYRQYLDPVSFADFQLSQELGHNVDGYRLSAKFYKWRDSVDARFKMVLWDMNLAYGNSDYYNGWKTDTWIYQNNALLNSKGDSQLVPFWWYKLNTDEFYTQLLRSRWAQYRKSNHSEERIMSTIDSIANLLTVEGAEQRNSQAWPRWGWYVWPNKYVAQNFEDEIAYLKEWITDRLAWMDEQLGYEENPSLPGDVNGDGTVDIADVNVVINAMLGKEENACADVNADGTVDIADVNAVINFMLGKQA